MFKNTGSGKTKKPAGGYGSHGSAPKEVPSQVIQRTGSIYSEASIAGKVTMKEALNVTCPKTQTKGNVTNRNGKAP